MRCFQQLAFSSKSSETSYKPTGRQEYTACQKKTIENGQKSFISSIFGSLCGFCLTEAETYSFRSLNHEVIWLHWIPSGFIFRGLQYVVGALTNLFHHILNKTGLYTYLNLNWYNNNDILDITIDSNYWLIVAKSNKTKSRLCGSTEVLNLFQLNAIGFSAHKFTVWFRLTALINPCRQLFTANISDKPIVLVPAQDQTSER